MPQTLTQIKALLDFAGLRPRKRFGQNFLIDHGKIGLILDAAALAPDDLVLEVGPGTGALTERLLDAGATVIAIEIDRDLCDILRSQFADRDRFTLIEGDVMDGKRHLNASLAQAMGDSKLEARSAKLVANLPYNIASPLLATLAADYPQVASGVVMVQREVADRMCAGEGGKDYGPLSIILQAMWELSIVTTLPPACFWPRPQIESAVVKFVRRVRPLTDDPGKLSALVQTLFSKRRKQIGTILGRDRALPPGIEPTMRPEQLTVAQIVAMSLEG